MFLIVEELYDEDLARTTKHIYWFCPQNVKSVMKSCHEKLSSQSKYHFHI